MLTKSSQLKTWSWIFSNTCTSLFFTTIEAIQRWWWCYKFKS